MERNGDKVSRYREWDLDCKVYVGNLGSAASKHEIESIFNKYGPLRNIWVARNPPGITTLLPLYYSEFLLTKCGRFQVLPLSNTRTIGTPKTRYEAWMARKWSRNRVSSNLYKTMPHSRRCCGTRIRVEMSSGRSRRDGRRGGGVGGGSGGRGGTDRRGGYKNRYALEIV